MPRDPARAAVSASTATGSTGRSATGTQDGSSTARRVEDAVARLQTGPVGAERADVHRVAPQPAQDQGSGTPRPHGAEPQRAGRQLPVRAALADAVLAVGDVVGGLADLDRPDVQGRTRRAGRRTPGRRAG